MIFMHPSEECGGEDALAVAVAAVAAATAVRSLFMTYVHTTDRPTGEIRGPSFCRFLFHTGRGAKPETRVGAVLSLTNEARLDVTL